ncbi:MAG: hypothetical protein IID32_12440, partial [Planctomycetes bacterium]|nr:hypothetical protein [Planctomycetota bacterium]
SPSETEVAFLPRHGKGHRYHPTNIPVHANIYALKSLGVQRILSISAVGSLKEEYEPLHLVVPDQLIDRTRRRVGRWRLRSRRATQRGAGGRVERALH